jgi:hypothetical protein
MGGPIIVKTLEEKIRDAINWYAVLRDDDAIEIVGVIFDDVAGALKQTPQFRDMPRDEIDLLLADSRNRAERDIGDMVDGAIQVESVIDDIVERFSL